MALAPPVETLIVQHRDRYGLLARGVAAAVAGLVAGALLVNTAQVGTAFAFGENADKWTIIQWGDHWVWRAVWGVFMTAVASFMAGMIARRGGQIVGGIVAAPTALFWTWIAASGWLGHVLFAPTVEVDYAIGYKIVASLLGIVSVPVGAVAGRLGAPFGSANAAHFDERRGSLLGVRWYHFPWLIIWLHIIGSIAVWSAMYAFSWLVASWKSGPSLGAFIPFLFLFAILAILQWSLAGLWKGYEVLAGFADPLEAGWRVVLRSAIGIPFLAALALLALSLVHYGIAKLLA